MFEGEYSYETGGRATKTLGKTSMSHRSHRITAESVLNMRFNERHALEMITVMLWPLAADERIGLLLTTLADNVRDVAETDEEIEAILDALTSLIEPLLIVFLGVIVGGIVIAMFLPIFKLNDVVSAAK